ncbi:efflux RND transporter periplasmic adaptor subunit [Cognaticolwellia mytili]|uniref:efflux RND transporter periplasmic adaptor subunit n=1 Tax=Cognaticolwellia mytili TaxID=1888913 RepID=UPI000A1755D1|nr:HlyD family efflux transporter periplasmic adaptor subunit [Cognaticolwellia mytili]
MKIELQQKTQWKKWLAFGLFILSLAYTAQAVTSTNNKTIMANEITLQTVQSGAVDIYSNAYGEFASARERLLTAPALGKVAEILVRPGTQVHADTIILTLANPKLEQEVGQARGELAQLEAQREAFKYEQQSERLDYQGRIADIEAEIEKAKLELSVNENLMTLGVASKIELQRAGLAVKQQSKRLIFEKKKYQQFIDMQSYQLTQRDITVSQQQAQLSLLEEQLDDMQVKAGIAGSLQNLAVELGQSVQLGESLAKVGSNKQLIARLRLPQHQADQIDINAPVIIDTQKGKIAAHITRIESVVTNGSVLAEASIDDKLTSNARPSLTISAQIFVKHQEDATFINQVSGIRPQSKQSVFVKTAENTLSQRDVSFAELSQGRLVITEGLISGDEIVSSDISKYNQFQELTIEH